MFRQIGFPLIFAIVFLSIACNSSKKTTANAASVKEKPAIHKLFTIHQGPCFGRCPVYEIYLTSDSILHLEGKNFMNYIGFYAKKLNPEQYEDILSAYHAIKTDSLAERYDAEIADIASVSFYFFDEFNVLKKKIVTQGNTPDPLSLLADKIRPHINQLGWERDPTAETVNPDEIIVQMKDGALVEKIIEDHWRYKLYVKETLSNSTGVYLIGFDKSSIDQGQLINLLKNDTRVMYAETNKKLNIR